MALVKLLIQTLDPTVRAMRAALVIGVGCAGLVAASSGAWAQEAAAPPNGAETSAAGAPTTSAPATQTDTPEARPPHTAPTTNGSSPTPAVPNGAAAAQLIADLLPQNQPGVTDELRQTIRRLPLELDRLQKATERLQDDSEGLATVRQEAEALQIDAQTAISQLTPLLPNLRTQLERLGEAPGENAAPEIPAIQAERAALNAAISAIDGAIKKLSLTETRTAQLLTRLQFARHNLFARDLLVRSPSPFSTEVWQHVVERAPTVVAQVWRVVVAWLDRLASNAIAFVCVLVVAGLGYVVSRHARQVFVKQRVTRLRTAAGAEPIGFIKRTWLAGALAPAFALPGTLGAAIVAGGIYGLALNNRQIDPILMAVLTGLLIYIAVASLSRAVLMPGYGDLRLVGVDDAGARRLDRLMRLLAFVSAIDVVLFAVIGALYLSEPYAVVAGTATAFAFAGLLIAIVTTPIEEDAATEGGRLLSRALSWSRIPVVLTALAISVAAAMGYLTLARFMSGQILVIGCGLVVVYLFHRAIVAATRTGDATVLDAAAGEPDSGSGFVQRTRVSDLLRYTLQALLAVAALFGLALSWGYTVSDIGSWTRTLIVGFDVGGVRISPAQILGALLLFA